MSPLDRVYLASTALILGFAALSAGGVTAPQWNICLAAVCALSFAVWLPVGRSNGTMPHDSALAALLILFPLYVALQLIPLPLSWLRTLSPARAELASAATPMGIGGGREPLSAAPALTMAQLLRLLCFICVFVLIRELTRRFAGRPWLAALPVIAIGSGEAALGLVQYLDGVPRATGTYVNPNHYSCFLQMILPFPLALAGIALRRKRGQEGRSPKSALAACALLGCAILIFLGALYSISRMGIAAIAASLLILVFLLPVARAGMRKTAGRSIYISAAAATVALMLALFVFAPVALLKRLENEDTREPLTADVRLRIWRETLPMTADYRIFGSGLGTYASVFQKYRASAPEYLVDFAHNDYLQLLAELGIIGFAIAGATGLMILVRIVRAVGSGPTTANRLMAAACAASILALMLDSSVDFDFYIPANAMLAAWIAGIGTTMGISRTQLE